ncbi:MAG: carbohydrate kinase family protein [Patescibacteria group bacterium]|nr:carbohydrate kinase family protein [Patescibacteria group bacterium]
MDNQLTTIGSATRDIFLIPKKVDIIDNKKDLTRQKLMAFEYGAKETVDYLSIHTGGTAVNVAVGLARQGIKTAANCAVGNDESGQSVLDTLKKEGVATSLVAISQHSKTDRSLIILDKKTGERTVFINKSASRHLTVDCSSIESESIFLSSLKYNWEKKFKVLEKCVVASHKRLFFTPGTAQIKAGTEKLADFLRQVEVIFLNEDEALEFTRQKTKVEIKEMMKDIYSYGPKVVVITAGEKGVYVYSDHTFFHTPSEKIKIKDATGAGDAFTSGFLATYLRGGSLKVAVKNGIRNSVSVITHLGTLEGLLKK